MRPGLFQAVQALVMKAEREGMAQPVPARLLHDLADALADLAYVASHGGGAEQLRARDGHPGRRFPAGASNEGA